MKLNQAEAIALVSNVPSKRIAEIKRQARRDVGAVGYSDNYAELAEQADSLAASMLLSEAGVGEDADPMAVVNAAEGKVDALKFAVAYEMVVTR